MEAARALGLRDALRPHMVATVIGLLASRGLRASEAIRLDVDLAGDLPCLHIQRTKVPEVAPRAAAPHDRRRVADLRAATP